MVQPRTALAAPAPEASADVPTEGLRAVVGLDLRSLAALRIGLGAALLFDLATRCRDLTAHYTDQGVLPAHLARQLFGPYSLHLWAHTAWGVGLLFALGMAAAAALMVGWHTRLATWVSFVLLVSLQHRNPMVGDFGDQTARVLLLWALFLPLGARASLDRSRARTAQGPNWLVSLATAAWVLQILIVYCSAAAHKAQHPAWYLGRELWYVLNLEKNARVHAHLLLAYPRVCEALTWGTLGMELLAPLVLLVPRKVQRNRAALALAFAGLHLGFFAFIRLGVFTLYSLLLWVPLVPGELWGRAGRWVLARAGAGRAEAASRSPEPTWAMRPLEKLAVVTLLAATEFTILAGLTPHAALAEALAVPMGVVGVDQAWTMYDDRSTTDGWWVAPAELANGARVDLVTERPVDLAKPADVGDRYGDQRWTDYLIDISHVDVSYLAPGYANVLCRRWNARHAAGDAARTVSLVFMREETGISSVDAPVKDERLKRWTCPAAQVAAR